MIHWDWFGDRNVQRLENILEIAVGKLVGGQYFVELDDFFGETNGDQRFGFLYQIVFVLLYLRAERLEIVQ